MSAFQENIINPLDPHPPNDQSHPPDREPIPLALVINKKNHRLMPNSKKNHPIFCNLCKLIDDRNADTVPVATKEHWIDFVQHTNFDERHVCIFSDNARARADIDKTTNLVLAMRYPPVAPDQYPYIRYREWVAYVGTMDTLTDEEKGKLVRIVFMVRLTVRAYFACALIPGKIRRSTACSWTWE